MDPTCQSFKSLKEAGNQIFKETFLDDSLSPAVYEHRMCKALQYYNKADNLARNAQEKSSILKNIATTKFRIGERLYTQKFQHQQPAFANLQSTKQLEKELKFYLEGSLEDFVEAAEIGKPVQNADWILKLTESQQECAFLLWNFFLKSLKKEKLSVLFRQLHKLCWNLTGLTRSKFFLKLGRLTFEKAIEHQDNGRFTESLELLRDNYLNIEEAKKDKYQIIEEAIELQESNFLHLSIGESTLARQKGDELWRGITMDQENIQMELVWDAVDCYVQSIVLSRDIKSLESEAMAHSHLGRLYELLRFNDKSHDHYKLTVDLVVAMQPKNFNDHSWHKQALAGLHKFQEQWKEKDEKERVRAPILARLKDVLSKIKRASTKSAGSLIDFIYANHPPKNGQQKSADGNLKTQLKMALLHYHPDKQNMETHGLKWMVLAEEITLLLTFHYTGFK